MGRGGPPAPQMARASRLPSTGTFAPTRARDRARPAGSFARPERPATSPGGLRRRAAPTGRRGRRKARPPVGYHAARGERLLGRAISPGRIAYHGTTIGRPFSITGFGTSLRTPLRARLVPESPCNVSNTNRFHPRPGAGRTEGGGSPASSRPEPFEAPSTSPARTTTFADGPIMSRSRNSGPASFTSGLATFGGAVRALCRTRHGIPALAGPRRGESTGCGPCVVRAKKLVRSGSASTSAPPKPGSPAP